MSVLVACWESSTIQIFQVPENVFNDEGLTNKLSKLHTSKAQVSSNVPSECMLRPRHSKHSRPKILTIEVNNNMAPERKSSATTVDQKQAWLQLVYIQHMSTAVISSAGRMLDTCCFFPWGHLCTHAPLWSPHDSLELTAPWHAKTTH